MLGIIDLVMMLVGWYGCTMYGDGGMLATFLLKRVPDAYLPRRIDGGMTFRIPSYRLKALRSQVDECGMTLEVDGGHGFLRLAEFLKKRPGLIVGGLLFFGMLYLSANTVWRVEYLDDEVDIDLLSERLCDMGLCEGAFIPSLDLDGICAEYILKYDELSWLSVNMFGNTARVEFLPMLRPYSADDRDDDRPSSLAASDDGQILYLNVTSGTPTVKVNDVVLKGQTVVSGIVTHKDESEELVRSRGSVYALVRRNVECFVPYEYTRRVPTGRSDAKSMLTIFGRNIKLYINKVKSFENCDIITEEKCIMLPFDTILPIRLTTNTYSEYDETTERLTQSEAEAHALKRLNAAITELTDDAELMSRTDTLTVTDGGVLCASVVYLVKDIAVEVELAK